MNDEKYKQNLNAVTPGRRRDKSEGKQTEIRLLWEQVKHSGDNPILPFPRNPSSSQLLPSLSKYSKHTTSSFCTEWFEKSPSYNHREVLESKAIHSIKSFASKRGCMFQEPHNYISNYFCEKSFNDLLDVLAMRTVAKALAGLFQVAFLVHFPQQLIYP